MDVKDIIETIAEKTEMIENLRDEINELKEESDHRMEEKIQEAQYILISNNKGTIMNTYTVRLQVIKVYDVEVNANSEDEAIETAMQSQTTEIERDGNLIASETDHAEIRE